MYRTFCYENWKTIDVVMLFVVMIESIGLKQNCGNKLLSKMFNWAFLKLRVKKNTKREVHNYMEVDLFFSLA